MADYPVTLSANRTSQLADIERAVAGYAVKYTVTAGAIAVATATGSTDTVTVTLGATPAKWMVKDAIVNVTTAFAGTTALTINVGTTSSTSAFVTAQSVMTAGVKNGVSTLPVLTNATATASVSLVAIFTNSTGGSPSAVTAGSCDIYLDLLDTTQLP